MYEYYNYENQAMPNGSMNEADQKEKAAQEKKNAKKARRKKLMSSIAYGLVFGIVAGGAFQTINFVGNRVLNTNQTTTEEAAEVTTTEEKTPAVPASTVSTTETADTSMAVADVAANSMPAIVSITNKSVQEVQMMFGMGTQEYESESRGSGIIVGQNDTELLVVTNNHVVSGAKTLTVSFIDNEAYTAAVKGTDSENDLAVIAVKLADIKDSTKEQIKVATLGDSSQLVIGEPVVAIGNALGYGQSVTSGIVSAVDREVSIENLTSKLIQTDAAINPGNSGGALLNMKGEVIGINSAKFASSQVEGMGYAIPISSVTPIIEELMNRETRELVADSEASYVGISGLSVTAEVSQTYGIPEGIYVSEVGDNTPAKTAGLMKGDVIKKFDGITIGSISELQEQLKYYKSGETVDVLIARADNGEYKEMTIPVTLGDRTNSEYIQSSENSSEEGSESQDSESQDNSGSSEDDSQNPQYNQGDIEDLFRFFGY